MDEERMKPGIG